MGIMYKTLERELYYKMNSNGYIVKIHTGKELYNKLKKDSKNLIVCYSNEKFSFDILKSSSCSEDFFFISPIDDSVIIRCFDYDDTWFSLCVGSVKNKTYKIVKTCLENLYKAGFSDTSLISFIRKNDSYYHLDVDGKDYGYLDNDLDDLEYKNMLVAIFKDIGSKVDVVVLPCKGEGMLFSDNVATYKTKKDFYKAILSRNNDSLSEVAATISDGIIDSLD